MPISELIESLKPISQSGALQGARSLSSQNPILILVLLTAGSLREPRLRLSIRKAHSFGCIAAID